MQAGEAIGVTEPCHWLCVFQGGADPATSPCTRADPTHRHTIPEQQGILEDWHTQLYAKPEVSQQVPLLKTM